MTASDNQTRGKRLIRTFALAANLDDPSKMMLVRLRFEMRHILFRPSVRRNVCYNYARPKGGKFLRGRLS